MVAINAAEIYRFEVGVLKRVFAKRGFGVTLLSEDFVDPEEKNIQKKAIIFFDDSNEYKFILVPS